MDDGVLALARKLRLRMSSEIKQSRMISRGDERYRLNLQSVKIIIP